MDKEIMFKHLVDNAFDFLSRAISEFDEYPKFSVINFHAAVELFVKARLMAEHWTLVIAKRQDADLDDFVAGNFNSVSLDEAASRLSKIVHSGLSKQQLDVFQGITKHRNKMVHFFHNSGVISKDEKITQSIAKEQLKAWFYLNQLLSEQWEDVFKPWTEQISSIEKELRHHHEFLGVVLENKKDEIARKESEGIRFEACPSCGFRSQEQKNIKNKLYDAKCLVCELIETKLIIDCPNCEAVVNFTNEGFSKCEKCGEDFEPDDIVKLLVENNDYDYVIEDEEYRTFGNCSDCDGCQTVVSAKDNTFVCLCCFGIYNTIQFCEWCNEPNTGHMDNSFWAGCSVCDGKSEWDKD